MDKIKPSKSGHSLEALLGRTIQLKTQVDLLQRENDELRKSASAGQS